MIFDTLEYVDAGGTTHEIALKLANLSSNGGAVRMRFMPRSHAPGEFHISWAQPPETGIAIPFKSRCKVYANRVSTAGAANSFSGGSILFQGRRTDNEGSASGSRVMTNITLSDALWDLTKITFQIAWQYPTGGTQASPTYTDFYWPDVILFQPFPGVTYSPVPVNSTINTFQQIKDIVDFAIGYAGGTSAVQLQIGSSPEFQPLYCNWYPVRSMKCSECLQVALRPHPGVFTEIDHTTTPPTIHFRNRANMTAITLPYKATDAAGIVHLATDIQPLNELVPDAVRLYYKINGEFDGRPAISYATDFWPVGAANSLLCHDYSIDVQGAVGKQTRVDFESEAFDPTDKNLWRRKVAALKQISQGGQIPNDASTGALAFVSTAAYDSVSNPKGIQVIDDANNAIDTGFYSYLTEQDVYAWMRVGTVPAGAIFATVKAFFTYDKKTTIGGEVHTDSMKEHEHHFRVLLTNCPSDTYVLNQLLANGESIPSGLAHYIFDELAELQWRLRHEIVQVAANETSLPTLIKPGKHRINLAGGDAAWETMNAVAENVSIEFFRDGENRIVAQQSISCGPVNHLEPGYLVQLTNLFVNRNRSNIDASQRLNGTVDGSQVDLTGNTARENSTAAAGVPVATNHVYESDGAVLGKIKLSAKDIADALAATPPTSIEGDHAPHEIKVVRCKFCADDGSQHYRMVPLGGAFTT